MEPLPNIPTPARLVWREIRHRAFPGMVFVVALVTAAILWRNQATVPHLVGEVEALTGTVATIEDGMITDLHVDQLQPVQKGQAIAEFRVADPESVRVKLANITAELQVMQSRMTQDQQRLLQGYEQLRLDWLEQRVYLATARVELEYAESELARVTKLSTDKLVSEDELDRATTLASSRRAEVAEREKLVAELKDKLDHLAPDDATRFQSSISEQLNQEIAAAEARLQLAAKPVTLTAPIDGVVTEIRHQSGERVARGETIVVITATTPRQIIGYLRPPLTLQPQPGDKVEVRTRNSHRDVGIAKILRVGGHFEAMAPNIAAANPGTSKLGLPVLVSLPDNLKLLPGEIVDLALKQ
ncbi:HlyD family efflux transporter periplasmic adaptor subunit [bacterium]|nr:HlyD family efflux transporter periplasmic adaptor subunit [bacterium]